MTREQTREAVAELLRKFRSGCCPQKSSIKCRETACEDCFADSILNRPDIAVVDREAKLPENPYDKYYKSKLDIIKYKAVEAYKKLLADFAKEVKE